MASPASRVPMIGPATALAAYGVTDWFEQVLYLPLYSVANGSGPELDGFKIRELFVVPHAANRTVFYGINFEFSYNAKHWDPNRSTSEIRLIIGWHFGEFDFSNKKLHSICRAIFTKACKGDNVMGMRLLCTALLIVAATASFAVEPTSQPAAAPPTSDVSQFVRARVTRVLDDRFHETGIHGTGSVVVDSSFWGCPNED